MEKYGLYLNGEWVPSSSGRTFQTANPATGEILASFSQGTREDVEKAVEAATKAQPAWRTFPAPRRGEILMKAARIMRDRKTQLGEMVTREMGKVIAEGKGDVQEAIDLLEYVAGEVLHDHPTTDRHRRPDHTMELSFCGSMLEIGACPYCREHCCVQTSYPNTPLRRYLGQHFGGSRASSGRAEHGHRTCGRCRNGDR
jgi:hypothetical protein